MRFVFSTLIGLIFIACLSGCASVKSTADYYIPYTTKNYPPKPEDYSIPILGRPPDRRYETIGRLAFRSDLGWKFMRQSMLYNARIHGADAILLKGSDSKKEIDYTYIPPRFDWIPVSSPIVIERKGKRRYYGSSISYIPILEPGYVRPWINTSFGIDAEMIVFKK